MNEVPNDIKRVLLQQKLGQWRNTLYVAMTDAKVAQKFTEAGIADGKVMMEQAKNQTKQCEIAIELLEAEIAGLDGAAQP